MSADGVFNVFTWVGVIALAFGVVSAVAIAISGNIRDGRLRSELAAAAQKLADTEFALERERIERLKLEKEVSPRRFTDEDAKVFEAELKGKIPPVFLISYGSSEVLSYSDHIAAALDRIGLIAIEGLRAHRFMMPADGGIRGVSVFIPVRTETEAQNDPLTIALKKAHVRVVGVAWGAKAAMPIPASLGVTLRSDERVIVVGEKPLPGD